MIDPADDTRRDYRCICDASGDAGVLDTLIARLAPGGAIVLAGFYDSLTFAFPPAFMREARILIAAQFTPADTATCCAGAIRRALAGRADHASRARQDAQAAYRTAFADAACLKMVLDWRELA